jgi:putative transposase
MAYIYRSLTPEERAEVIRQRLEQGYPLHAPPHPFRMAGYYLVTASNFEHKHIMELPQRKTDFETRLLAALQDSQAGIVGWVVLSNHYHVLVGVETLDIVSIILKQLHGATSREWNLADNLTGKRRVWYRFADRMIRNEAHYYQALNYIHINPVKHGYVKSPYDWFWSSLAIYLDEKGRDWLREQWEAHPPGDFGKRWDND